MIFDRFFPYNVQGLGVFLKNRLNLKQAIY